MKKLLTFLLSILIVFEVLIPVLQVNATSKEVKKKDYVLCVDNYSVFFNKDTGYISIKDKKTYLPIKELGQILGYNVKISDNKKTIILKKGKNKYTIKANKNYIIKNGKSIKLTTKTYMQDKKHLMVPVEIVSKLGIHYKIYNNSKGKGYKSGVIVISTKGEVQSLPKKQMHSDAIRYEAAKTTDQLVIVKYLGGTKAKVSLHEKTKKGQWKKLKEETGYVGKNGIGKTREWDRKTPKGTYNFGQAFGIKSNPGTKVSYIKVNKYHYAVDDHKYPKYYNRLIDVRTLGLNSIEGEHIIKYGAVYNYCVYINYNDEQKIGKGSSIFLHCYGRYKYTEGCVAVSEKMMVFILKRLKNNAKIAIY